MKPRPNPAWRSERGHCYEKLALWFLRKQGLRLVKSNFHCRMGEIDLIMQQQDMLIFVEVRFRTGSDFGNPMATVTRKKQQKIIHTASYYLQTHPSLKNLYCRFDVVGISININNQPQYTWIQNAFY